MAIIKPFKEAPWFSIDEDQYLMYLLKGYGSHTSKYGSHVYFNLDGKFHREDGPAVIHKNDTVEYWQNGKRHREDGPAVIYSDGNVAYWQNGKRHREDGPAIIRSDGTVAYYLDGVYLNGVEYSKEKFY